MIALEYLGETWEIINARIQPPQTIREGIQTSLGSTDAVFEVR